MGEVRVVIVDDSQIVRRLLRRLVEDEAGFTVVAEGENGAEAVALAARLRPDLMLIDLAMPGSNGIEALALIMERSPTRVVLVTSVVRYGGHSAIHAALEQGAVDLVSKNEVLTDDGAAFRRRLRGLAEARIGSSAPPSRPPVDIERRAIDAVVVGASAGGPGELRELVSGLKATFPASLTLAQHMPSEFGEAFITWIAKHARLPVHEAKPGVQSQRGRIYVLARGRDLGFDARGIFVPVVRTQATPHEPSIDALFESAAKVYGPRAAGVILTGMGSDGARGLALMRQRGALTIAEHEKSAIVDGMPRAAREAGAASLVLMRAEIATWLAELG